VATSRSSSSLLAGTNTKALFGALSFYRFSMPPLAAPVALAPLPAWFAAKGRALPWRAGNLELPHPDPYAVLVSEMMLQQTQVATVVPYFTRWMSRFPDARTLALAQDDEVHKHWEGLGYYRRVRFLKQTAIRLTEQGWPQDLKGLLALPGLGPYTAAAIAAIAFQLPEPALEGNVFRVLARLLGLEGDPRRQATGLRAWLRPALVAHGPSRITQALMELGALLCSPQPTCAACPLAASCEALRQGSTDRIPPVRERSPVKTQDIWLMAIQAEDHWLLLKPAAKGLLAGLWRWPTCEKTPEPAVAVFAAETGIPYLAPETRVWQDWSQLYSHRKERVTPIAIGLPGLFPAPPGCAWIPGDSLSTLPLGKRDQRLRALLGQEADRDAQSIPVAQLLCQVRKDTSR